MARNDAAAEIIAGFGRKYPWWEPVGKWPHSEDRIIAQTMNLGTYDDAAMISAGVSLAAGISAFKQMFDGEPAQVLRSIGYFGDGDLNTLTTAVRNALCGARDQIGRLPEVHLKPGPLTGCT
jgi:hypothetical protein